MSAILYVKGLGVEETFVFTSVEDANEAAAMADQLAYGLGGVATWVEPPKDFLPIWKAEEKMRALAESDDYEDAHGQADSILCKVLQDLGCESLVELYRDVPKWYA